VLFTASTTTGGYEDASLAVLSLESGAWKTVHTGGYHGRWIPTGHLIYVRQGTLFAVQFDADRHEVRGTPVPLLDDVGGQATVGAGNFDVSRNGTLVYLFGEQLRRNTPMVWLDASNKMEPMAIKPGVYSGLRVSPDGHRLVFVAGQPINTDIQVYDWQRDTLTRLTSDAKGNLHPVWAPDGKHVVYATRSAEGYSIRWIRADGPVESQVLFQSKNELRPSSFNKDGTRLGFAQDSPETGMDLWILPLDLTNPDRPQPGSPEPFLRAPGGQMHTTWSPDERWIAYQNRGSVYVQSFPGPGGRWQVSDEGRNPKWSVTGSELFYEGPDGGVMVVSYRARGDGFIAEKPRPWSAARILDSGIYGSIDPAPDGERLAALPAAVEEAAGDARSLQFMFFVNFFDEVRRRVPER
jgi:serine/threonine-protein kinase